MFLQRIAQPQLFGRLYFLQLNEIVVKDVDCFSSQYVGKPARHSRSKIQSERPQDNCHATRHVFATMLTHAFHDRERPAVADSKPFACASRHKEPARRCAIQNRIADQHVTAA